jgi:DNA repair protein RecN (Recombination protein N)
MIESLRIENLAVLERAEIELGGGLNVLTGETGAGKSIVLGALALLAGSRASQDVIRDGASEAIVEAVFRVEGDEALARALERLGVEVPDGELVVRRSVARSGRGRARLGGELVPVSTLADLFRGRLEISSQHESHRAPRGAPGHRPGDGRAPGAPRGARAERGFPQVSDERDRRSQAETR